jgi:hypothetical protein
MKPLIQGTRFPSAVQALAASQTICVLPQYVVNGLIWKDKLFQFLAEQHV